MATATESPAVQSDPGWTGIGLHAPTRARAREATSSAAAVTADAVRTISRGKLFDATPATVRQVAAYTKAGGWVPGDRARWLEWFGKAYGYAVALPVTAACYVGLWFVQRPTRVVLGGLLWVAARWAL